MIIAVWVILALVMGAWNSSKGHSAIGGFLMSLLLSPLIAFIIIAVRSPYVKGVEAKAIAAGDMKKCPACAELIKQEAVKCRYCGTDLPAPVG